MGVHSGGLGEDGLVLPWQIPLPKTV